MMKNKIKAIILAAGRGSRMGESTEALPKCLLRLYGKPLLEWQTEALRAAGIDPISIVTGYKQETLAFPGFKFFHNPRWQETHMVSSLCRASQWLERDTCVVSYSDIVYSADTVTRLLNAEGDIVISYDSQWLRLWRARFEDPLKDAETFRLDEQGRMLEIGGKTRNLEDIQGQYMGLLKFTPKGWADTRDYLSSLPEPEVGFRKSCPQFWVHYFITAMDTGMRPNEQMALRWFPDAEHPEKSSYVDFDNKKIFIGQGWVRGRETDLKTSASYREIDMLPTVERALHAQQQGIMSLWVFPNADGGRLDLDNLRVRVWYPTLQRAGLRQRDLYQCRHTFASLMLQSGEDPAWVARMMGHTTTKTLYERYHRFIQNRSRRDGELYLKRLEG